MNRSIELNYYQPLEETFNVLSHAFGALLSCIAWVLLSTHPLAKDNLLYSMSLSVFGVSLVALYVASTLYHYAKTPRLRLRLKIIDHASIYVLIAGTYTPFTLITLGGTTGWLIFSISWGMAFIGISLKLFFTGRYQRISTLMYVFMGWMIIFAIKPMIDNLPLAGLYWFFAGGGAYTLGAIVYSIKSVPMSHAIFHVLVLVGSFSHFMSVYFYVLPGKN